MVLAFHLAHSGENTPSPWFTGGTVRTSPALSLLTERPPGKEPELPRTGSTPSPDIEHPDEGVLPEEEDLGTVRTLSNSPVSHHSVRGEANPQDDAGNSDSTYWGPPGGSGNTESTYWGAGEGDNAGDAPDADADPEPGQVGGREGLDLGRPSGAPAATTGDGPGDRAAIESLRLRFGLAPRAEVVHAGGNPRPPCPKLRPTSEIFRARCELMNYLWPKLVDRREVYQRLREDPSTREEHEDAEEAGADPPAEAGIPGTRAWLEAQNDVGRLVEENPSVRDFLLQAVIKKREYQAASVTRTPSPTPSEESDDARNKYGHRYDPNPTLLTTEYDVDVDDGRAKRAEARLCLAEWDGYLNFPEAAAAELTASEIPEEDDRPDEDRVPLPGMTGPLPPAVAATFGPDMYGRYFTDDQLRFVREIMVASVGMDTARQYLAGPRHWNGFRLTIAADRRPSEFLVEFTGQFLLQGIWIVLFAKYASEVHGFFADSLRALITGLAFHFRCNHPFFDTRMFAEEMLTKARKAFALPPAAVCDVILGKVLREKYPLAKEFHDAFRETHWSPTPPTRALSFEITAEAIKMQCYISYIYLLSWGGRGQNILTTRGPSKALLNGTVVFTFLVTREPWVTLRLTGGGPARQHMRDHTPPQGGYDYSQLLCVEYVVMVTKTINSTSAQTKGHTTEMPTTICLVGLTPMETHAKEAMGVWEYHSYGQPADRVATVYHPTERSRRTQVSADGTPASVLMNWNGRQRRCARREPSTSALAKAFKAVSASREGGGVAAEHISIGSVRKFWPSNEAKMMAYATEVAKEGPSGVDEIVRRLGGWAPGSRVVNLHYTKAQTMPSGFALMVPGAEAGVLTGAQINMTIEQRTLMAKGAAGQGASNSVIEILDDWDEELDEPQVPEVAKKTRAARKSRARVKVEGAARPAEAGAVIEILGDSDEETGVPDKAQGATKTPAPRKPRAKSVPDRGGVKAPRKSRAKVLPGAAPAKAPRKSRAAAAETPADPADPAGTRSRNASIVDISDSEEEPAEASAPNLHIPDSRGTLHDMALVVCGGRESAPIDFKIPFLANHALRPSMYTSVDPAIQMGQALAVPPRADGRTGQPVEEFRGEIFRVEDRVIPEGKGAYILALGRGYAMDCSTAFANGTCIASGANTAINAVDPSGRVLKSGDNNCHVAVDWTVADRPRVYLYLSRPLPYDPENWTELMWPYGASYQHAPAPLTLGTVENFGAVPKPPTKKARHH